jgi:hypothetical protein
MAEQQVFATPYLLVQLDANAGFPLPRLQCRVVAGDPQMLAWRLVQARHLTPSEHAFGLRDTMSSPGKKTRGMKQPEHF